MENPNIYEAICNVMSEIGAIGKNKKNQQQGFMYRGVDDVMNALQPALIKHKVFIAPEVVSEQREERETKLGGVMFSVRLEVIYKFYTTDGSSISTKVIGEAMDSGDKATNKAMSVAYKYACFQVFCIPTEEMKDPDADTPPPLSPSEAAQIQKEMQIRTQKITQAKIRTIEKELERTGLVASVVCERYKVDTISDITEELFPKVMEALKKTPAKVD
jgi:hypothetical protein